MQCEIGGLPVELQPSSLLTDYFTDPKNFSDITPKKGGGLTFLAALSYQGGNLNKGAKEILMRAAVASLLNACGTAEFPYTPDELIAAVDAALAAGRSTMIELARILDAINNGIHDDSMLSDQSLAKTALGLSADAEIPTEFSLHQNYPNPFNPMTTIAFGLPETSRVRLAIYDVLGREVMVLVNDELSAGTYRFAWNADGLASGMYIYALRAGDFSQTKSMILLK
jgi:hypothetical protein